MLERAEQARKENDRFWEEEQRRTAQEIADNPEGPFREYNAAVASLQAQEELRTAVRLAGDHGDLLAFTVSNGLRLGEVAALWCGEVNLVRGTVRVNKAWKRDGEDG